MGMHIVICIHILPTLWDVRYVDLYLGETGLSPMSGPMSMGVSDQAWADCEECYVMSKQCEWPWGLRQEYSSRWWPYERLRCIPREAVSSMDSDIEVPDTSVMNVVNGGRQMKRVRPAGFRGRVRATSGSHHWWVETMSRRVRVRVTRYEASTEMKTTTRLSDMC